MAGLSVFITLTFIILLVPPNALAKSFQEDLTLTIKQKQILDEFRQIMEYRLPKDYMHEDVYLMRWLRARDWNIRKAEDFLLTYLQWREDNRMDRIDQEDFSDFVREYPFPTESRDKEGRPLLYLNLGDMDIRNLFVKGGSERFARYTEKRLEDACGLVRELGRKYQNVSQGSFIMNLDGFNLVQQGCFRCVPLLLAMISSYENHHPGCADKFIVVNTPELFTPVLNAGKALMSKDTKSVLTIIGTNKKEIRDLLSKHYEWNQLPPELGGTLIYGEAV